MKLRKLKIVATIVSLAMAIAMLGFATFATWTDGLSFAGSINILGPADNIYIKVTANKQDTNSDGIYTDTAYLAGTVDTDTLATDVVSLNTFDLTAGSTNAVTITVSLKAEGNPSIYGVAYNIRINSITMTFDEAPYNTAGIFTLTNASPNTIGTADYIDFTFTITLNEANIPAAFFNTLDPATTANYTLEIDAQRVELP